MATNSIQTQRWLCTQLQQGWQGLTRTEQSLPPPEPGEVQLRMLTAAANFPDLLMLQGAYQFKPELPFAPGMEGCGVVIATGDRVSHLQPGQRLMVGARCGLFATTVNVPQQACTLAPADLSDSEAAAMRVPFLTAWIALKHRAALQAGEKVLVHGATGGVGMAAVHLAQHMGAEVMATSSSADKLQKLMQTASPPARTLVLDADATNLKEAVLDWTQGAGADVIYDPVGGAVFDQSCRCISWSGRLLVIGFASGSISRIGVNIPLIKGFSIMGVRAGETTRRNPKLAAQAAQAQDEAIQAGIRPHIYQEIPFDQAPLTLAALERREVIGKITTRISHPT
ncbi:MAG: NADPH:quinone oxidoreductase family protein [Gammaproteobacteria bacterium]